MSKRAIEAEPPRGEAAAKNEIGHSGCRCSGWNLSANLRVVAPPNPGDAVVNVVYVDVLEVGEARSKGG